MKRRSIAAVSILALFSLYLLGALFVPNASDFALYSPLVSVKAALSNGISTAGMVTASPPRSGELVSHTQLKNSPSESALFAFALAGCTAFFTLSWPFKRKESAERVADVKRAMGEADVDIQIPFKKGMEPNEAHIKDDATVKKNIDSLLGQMVKKKQ